LVNFLQINKEVKVRIFFWGFKKAFYWNYPEWIDGIIESTKEMNFQRTPTYFECWYFEPKLHKTSCYEIRILTKSHLFDLLKFLPWPKILELEENSMQGHSSDEKNTNHSDRYLYIILWTGDLSNSKNTSVVFAYIFINGCSMNSNNHCIYWYVMIIHYYNHIIGKSKDKLLWKQASKIMSRMKPYKIILQKYRKRRYIIVNG